ncbi:nucleotide exchange factor GrpE [Desulfobacterales bacterium HSG2]|nr:nucleotide exchange factor GrpE [Desulfobacterales bacterium HSG2]
MTENKDMTKDHPETEELDKEREIPETDDSPEEETETDDPVKELEKKVESAEQEIKETQDRLSRVSAEAEQEIKETQDRLLRVSAEFENYKKRSAREMEGFKKFANESLIKEMLPVVDNLERAIDSSGNDNDNDGSIVEGVNMIRSDILKAFEKFGVKPIVSVGEPFDPGFHEAVMQEESEEHSENTVTKELQKGYTMNERLLRPSMVIVSKAKAKDESEEKESGNT